MPDVEQRLLVNCHPGLARRGCSTFLGVNWSEYRETAKQDGGTRERTSDVGEGLELHRVLGLHGLDVELVDWKSYFLASVGEASAGLASSAGLSPAFLSSAGQLFHPRFSRPRTEASSVFAVSAIVEPG